MVSYIYGNTVSGNGLFPIRYRAITWTKADPWSPAATFTNLD